MSIEVSCNDCRKVYKVPENMAGKRVKCKSCGNAFSIPEPIVEPPEIEQPDDEYELKDDFGFRASETQQADIFQPSSSVASGMNRSLKLPTPSLAGAGAVLAKIPTRAYGAIAIICITLVVILSSTVTPFVPPIAVLVLSLFALLNLAIGTMVVVIRCARESGQGLDLVFVALFFLTGILPALLYAWAKNRGTGVHMGTRMLGVLYNSLAAAAAAFVLYSMFGAPRP